MLKNKIHVCEGEVSTYLDLIEMGDVKLDCGGVKRREGHIRVEVHQEGLPALPIPPTPTTTRESRSA